MGKRLDHDSSYINYTYERPPEVQLQVCHGVWGGINPHGEIEMNFYNESDIPPRFSVQQVAPDGSLGEEKINAENMNPNIMRHIHSRVLMNYDTARAVLEWLEDRVTELETDAGTDIFPVKTGIEQ